MKLLVDIGNSRVKWGLATGAGRAEPSIEGPWGFDRAPGSYARAWGDLDPAAVFACSVAGEEALTELRTWAFERWTVAVTEVRTARQSGAVVNGYREPSALGVDRWLNLLGARVLLGPVDAVVVDAGTAVTIDVLQGDGRHTGGVILAGLAASRAGLGNAAPSLPTPAESDRVPADSTAAAIGAGTLLGLVGAIERLVSTLAQPLTRPAFVLTGGDAARLLPYLGAHWRHDPLITLRGLHEAGMEASCAG